MEPFACLRTNMPTGVSVAPNGRIFLCFPRWFDRAAFTVGELMDDRSTVVPYPNAEINALDFADVAHHFISVQSVIVTGESTLWVLDTGRPAFLPALPHAIKLVEIDLRRNAVKRSYEIPYGIARLGTYVNDVRFVVRDGKPKTAYITDSATITPSAIIVIDLETGEKLRRLDGHVSVQPQADGTPVIEGQALRIRLVPGVTFPYDNGADGIALSPDGGKLYYCPLSSRRLYSVDAALLADPAVSDAEVANSVLDLGPKAISDGLECDSNGRVYAGDLEHNCIHRLEGGTWQMFDQDARMIWTDTLSVAADGFLYHTANQLNRMPIFNYGAEKRVPPYLLFRSKI